MRRSGVLLIFNSDLPGSSHDIFYGMHAAMTRRNTKLEPDGGWHPEQCATPEETVRAYTVWAARAAHEEDRAGIITEGRRGDLTVLEVDPFALGETDPAQLLQGTVALTIVGGRIAYDRARSVGGRTILP